MPTTARGIWTPSDTDAVDFTTDLATMAGTIDNALDLYGNALRGTASQRAAFLSTAADGMLWQDTDGIRMIWRKDGALWVPAVWRWRGTTAQMNSFGANAPDGFEWFSTTNNSEHVRLGGAWHIRVATGSFTVPSLAVGAYHAADFSFPSFPREPIVVPHQESAWGIPSSYLIQTVSQITTSSARITFRNVASSGSSSSVTAGWAAILR